MTRTQSMPGWILVVGPGAETDALLVEPALAQIGLAIERAEDPDTAIARVERGAALDVILLAPRLPEPVRLAQRLHSLDRLGAVVVLADAAGEADLRHALSVAPFLGGDVSLIGAADADSLVDALSAASARTRERRGSAARLKKRRETPPPLSARYLGTLLDSAPIGIATLDAAGDVIGWNRRTGEMLGVPEVEALGSAFADLFADDRERLGALIEGFGTSGLDDDGQVFERGGRSFELTGARFAIRSGESGSLLILQDVTKRRAAERELELQRALMAAQADSSRVGIAVVAMDGSVERINRRWTEIWGIDAELLRREPVQATQIMLDQVVDPEAFVAGATKLAETGGGEFRDEVALKDGRAIERYATHVRDDAGELIGRIWFHTDITEHRREEESLRFLADATNLLSSSLDHEKTLQSVADLAVPRMADWCSIEIADTGEVAEAGVAATGQTAPLTVPIKVRDRVFGTLNFVRGSERRAFTRDDAILAEELARRAAIAIDNSRVHAELRATARTLQESLLPPDLPDARGLELAARFRPAGAGMEVGGDFYDIFEVGPDRWAIAVGDVCGKGADAAALTALTRYTVRAAAMYERDVHGVLRVLNEALLRQRGDHRFTTLVFCVVDLAAERPTLRLACGGHPRPLLLRPDGTAEAVGAVGPLLGVVPDAGFHSEHVELEQGDALVLYTDGLTDALAPQRMLGEDDLLTVLGGCADASAGEIAERLEHLALGDDPSHVPRDDIALVVAKLAGA